jgi:hypothetical protein
VTDKLRFDDWYYGGPFLRVENPDTDFPRRDPLTPISSEWRTRTELDGQIQGERFVAPFNDANSVDDILGGLLFAAEYPDGWDDDERHRFPTIQGILAETTLRLETKLRHKTSAERGAAFTSALELLRSAARLFAAGQYELAQEEVWKAHAAIETGNRSKRRKTSFVADSEGGVSGA